MWQNEVTTSSRPGVLSFEPRSTTESSSGMKRPNSSTRRSTSSPPPKVTMSWESPTPETTATMMTSLVEMMRGCVMSMTHFADQPTWGIGYAVSVQRPRRWTDPWLVTLDMWPEPHPAMPDELLR